MQRLWGFPPVAAPGARCLILGSMPGAVSLRHQAYYAHRQNAFWRILGALGVCDPGAPYAERLTALARHGIALWDVIAGCERPGSLDADIVAESVQVNNFPAFFAAYPRITQVFFNGAKAETAFRQHVLPMLDDRSESLRLLRLPSTSPAHAALPYGEKVAAWRAILAE